MRFNNPVILTLLLLATVLLEGCSGSKVRRAEPVQVTLPEFVEPQRIFTPETLQAYGQALTLIEQEQPEQAITALKQLLSTREDIPGAWYNLAVLEYRLGNHEQALSNIEKHLEFSPRNAEAQTFHGLLLRQKGQFKPARLAYSKALHADKNYAPAHLNLAILFDIYLQFLEDAKEHYLIYLALSTDTEQSDQVRLWLSDLEVRIQQEQAQQ